MTLVHFAAVVPSTAQTRAATDDDVQGLAQRAATGGWDRFSARVTVRRQWVTDAGVPTGPAATADEYVWEREQTTNGWKSRMTVVAGPRATVRTRQGDTALPDGQEISWMEDAEDGSSPRFFSRGGAELRPSWRQPRHRAGTPAGPGAEVPIGVDAGSSGIDLGIDVGIDVGIDAGLVTQATNRGMLRRSTGREWIASFVMLPGRASARLRTVTAPYGRRTGWVRGYGRYLRADGARSLELLVDEQDGVPVEANVVAGGGLHSHTTFRYERAASGALMRRGVRVERPMSLPDAASAATSPGLRLVTDISYSQVRLLSKGGR